MVWNATANKFLKVILGLAQLKYLQIYKLTFICGSFFLEEASHSLIIFPHKVQRSSSVVVGVVVVAPEDEELSSLSAKLHPDVTEICDVSEERRE